MVIRKICVIILFITGISGLTAGSVAPNLLYNSDFEDKGYIYDWKAVNGNVSQVKQKEHVFSGTYSAYLKLKPGAGSARLENKRPRIAVVAGETYSFSVWAKGRGALKLCFLRYGDHPVNIRALKPIYSTSFNLSDHWQQFHFKHTFTSKRVLDFSVGCILSGSGSFMYIDKTELVKKASKEYRLTAYPHSLMAVPGQQVTCQITLSVGGTPVTNSVVNVDLSTMYDSSKTAAVNIHNGVGELLIRLPSDIPYGAGRIDLFHPESGQGQRIYLNVIKKQQFDEMEKAALNLRKPLKPIQVLVLGDSLSDLYRGHNYVDELAYWTSVQFPRKITWQNFGVRGDYISRIYKRIKGQPVWGRRRYKGILSAIPDVAMIFCGHNDSRLTVRSNFKKTKVLLADFKTYLANTVSFLRTKNPAIKVLLLTPVSSNYQATKAKWDASGQKTDLFGSPKVLNDFAIATHDVAQKMNCLVIDLYQPTLKNVCNASLFIRDGVHLSAYGNYIVALEILKKLGTENYFAFSSEMEK